MDEEVKKNDIIQIKSDTEMWGCLAVVDSVRAWGVQCYIKVPTEGNIWARFNHGDYDVVGALK